MKDYNFVEKNLFLSNRGFKKEKKNFKLLYNFNGDEHKALALLEQIKKNKQKED